MKKIILSTVLVFIFFGTKIAVSQVFTVSQKFFSGVCAGYSDIMGTDTAMFGASDATAMHDALINNKFWNNDSVHLLTGSYATRTSIKQYIQSMPPMNTRLFYFAGHGGSVKYGNSGNRTADGLLPWVNYNGPNDPILSDTNQRITPYQLTQWLGLFNNGPYNCVVYLDACFSGMFPKYIQGIITYPVWSSACADTESTSDDYSAQHGVYTEYLLKALSNPSNYLAASVHNAIPNVLQGGSHPQINSNYSDINIAGPTLSGTFFRSEAWHGQLTLLGNVTIPSGYSLAPFGSTNLSLGGHSIVSTGGTIDSTLYATGAVYLKQGSVVNGMYPTLSKAVSAAKSGQTIVINNAQTLSGNLILPSGVSFTINAGSTINLNGHSISTSGGGTITIQSGATITGLYAQLQDGSGNIIGLYPSIQNALTPATSGQTVIVFGTNTISSSIIIKSGIIFKITQNAVINLNGNINITSNDGTIIIQNGAIINNGVVLLNGNIITGIYATIQRALAAHTGQEVDILGNYNLSADITISTNIALDLKNNAIVKLVGHSIISNGGTIIVENGGIINGVKAQVQIGSNIIGYCPDIESANNYAINGQTINVIGNETLSSNLSINPGVTLVINSGVTINLNGYSITSSGGGTIIIQSGAKITGLYAQIQDGTGNIIGLHPSIQSALTSPPVNSQIIVTGTNTIPSNLSIPQGVTFTISSNTVINLNGYTITNSGTINIQSGAQIINGAVLWNGNAISGIYPTIEAALTHPGQEIDVLGDYTLDAIFTLPAGVNLKIVQGTFNFNGGSIFVGSGSFNIFYGVMITGIISYLENGSTIKGYCGSIKSACGNAGNGDVVSIVAGTITEKVNLSVGSSFTICGMGIGQTNINGTITLITSSPLTLNLNSFTCIGLFLNGCNPNIQSVDIESDGINGLCIYNCASFLAGTLTVQHETYGNAFNISSSSGYVYAPSHFDNNTRAVYATGNSTFYFYNQDQTNLSLTFCGNNPWDIYTDNTAVVYADACSFNGDSAKIHGKVFTNGNRACTGLQKTIIATNSTILNSNDIIDPALGDFRIVDSSFLHLGKKIKIDIDQKGFFDRAKFKNDYKTLIGNTKDFIDRNPLSSLSKIALLTSIHSFEMIEDYDSLKIFLQSIISDRKFSKLNGLAKRSMIDYYRINKDFGSALSTADELLNNNSDTALVCDVLYEKGLICAYDIDDQTQAIDCFSNIVNNYPNNALAIMAENELNSFGIKIQKKPNETKTFKKPTEFAINSYPNPFNPTTTINYQLPEAGKVTMVVYDLLGRTVANLVNETKDVGVYSTIFDGSHLSSGFYFVKLDVETLSGKSFVKTLKIQMLK